MTGDLEARYRRLAAWYPRSWRAANEDVLIGTMLDIAEAEGRTEPSRADRWDLARAGAAARLDALVPARARDAIAASALGSGGAFALVYFVFVVWAPFLPDRAVHLAEAGSGPFLSTGAVTAVAFAALVVLACVGHRRSARIAGVVTVVAAAGTLVVGRAVPDPASAAATNMLVLGLLAGLSLLGAPRRIRTVPLVGAAWLVVLVGGLAVNDRLLGIGERELWTAVANPYSVPPAAALALLVAVALLATGRPVPAVVTASGTLPWLGATALQAVDAPAPDPVVLLLHAVCLVAAAAISAHALRRTPRPVREPGAAAVG